MVFVAGRAGFKHTDGKIEIQDMQKLVALIEKEKLDITIDKSVRKTALKEYKRATGRLPRYVKIMGEGDNFYVST
jgi:predicted transposase YbfD/YdcC